MFFCFQILFCCCVFVQYVRPGPKKHSSPALFFQIKSCVIWGLINNKFIKLLFSPIKISKYSYKVVFLLSMKQWLYIKMVVNIPPGGHPDVLASLLASSHVVHLYRHSKVFPSETNNELEWHFCIYHVVR